MRGAGGRFMRKIRVLVVDDSAFMSKQISCLIEEDEDLKVIGIADDGWEAVSLVRELKPDVVTWGGEMWKKNGMEALTTIMEQRPTPILMLSSLAQAGASTTIYALLHGAVDFISKPSGSFSFDLYKLKVKAELVSKIKQAAQIPLRNLIMNNLILPNIDIRKKRSTQNGLAKEFDQILALGTSTGGPKALETVITALPASFPYPLLLVQHMPPKFTKSLAERLNGLSGVRVVEAKHNERLLGGTVYIAPGDYHMTAVQTSREYRIKLHQKPSWNGFRPSVDVLFDSISQLKNLKRHFILMTGIGSDGAKGMLSAKQAGAASTMVESKESCIVFGMPKSAIALNCVDYTVPLHLITSKIMEVTGIRTR
ncbi:Chemotaxis response regulator protein-glutamate methylesterase [compost metagenome]